MQRDSMDMIAMTELESVSGGMFGMDGLRAILLSQLQSQAQQMSALTGALDGVMKTFGDATRNAANRI